MNFRVMSTAMIVSPVTTTILQSIRSRVLLLSKSFSSPLPSERSPKISLLLLWAFFSLLLWSCRFDWMLLASSMP